MREQTALERFSIAWMANLAQRRGTRRTPLYPPFARGEKDQTPPTFPPLRRGGRGGESRGACNASEKRSNHAPIPVGKGGIDERIRRGIDPCPRLEPGQLLSAA